MTTDNTYITLNSEKKDTIEMDGFSNAAVADHELVRNIYRYTACSLFFQSIFTITDFMQKSDTAAATKQV